MNKIISKRVLYAVGILAFILAAGFYVQYERSRQQDIIELTSARAAPRAAATEQSALTLEAPEQEPAVQREAVQPDIKVYIAGEVIAPGVYELRADSRVEDALKLAGGASGGADLLRINLAAHLKDGQRIIVPKQGEPVDKSLLEEENNTDDDVGKAESALININTADAGELMKLPGVGTVTADNIIRYRTDHGNFSSINDIQKVTRIGEKTFEKLKDLIAVN
ncbi:MAG: ComEA family DNA-binding protein [Clostridiales bacterium]|jgi:competence protein ComEA|nr:ComEA family DNA-binding protein [Clostridiales bacterium]